MGHFDDELDASGAWSEEYDIECRVCHDSFWMHEYGYKRDEYEHPFIKDNLDYLAWKHEQKLLSLSKV